MENGSVISMLNASNDSLGNESHCLGALMIASVKEHIAVKMILLLCITPIICALGITGNILALVTFFHNRHKYRGNATFLMGLSLCDNGVLLLTLAIYTVEVMWAYLDSVQLYYAWISYLKVAYYLSHVFQISAVSLTTMATIEQYLAVRLARTQNKIITCSVPRPQSLRQSCPGMRFCSQKITLAISVTCIAFYCIPKLLSIYIVEMSQCPGYGRYFVDQSPFGKAYVIRVVYDFWVTNILTVFIPFILILIFNVLIAYQFTSSRKKESGILIVVVATVFLICNAPSLCLTAMEYQFLSLLLENGFIYSLLRDIANIFVTLNSAVNFYAYLIVGMEFRKEFTQTLRGRAPWLGATFRLVSLPVKMSQEVPNRSGHFNPGIRYPRNANGNGRSRGRSPSMDQTIGWFQPSSSKETQPMISRTVVNGNATLYDISELSASSQEDGPETTKCTVVRYDNGRQKCNQVLAEAVTFTPQRYLETVL